MQRRRPHCVGPNFPTSGSVLRNQVPDLILDGGQAPAPGQQGGNLGTPTPRVQKSCQRDSRVQKSCQKGTKVMPEGLLAKESLESSPPCKSIKETIVATQSWIFFRQHERRLRRGAKLCNTKGPIRESLGFANQRGSACEIKRPAHTADTSRNRRSRAVVPDASKSCPSTRMRLTPGRLL